MVVKTILLAGYLSAYALNPTVGTLNWQQENGHIPDNLDGYDVFLAVEDCGMVGMDATLYVAGDEHNALIFDCAGADAFSDGESWMERNNIVAEVDFWTWQENPEYIGNEFARIAIAVPHYGERVDNVLDKMARVERMSK